MYIVYDMFVYLAMVAPTCLYSTPQLFTFTVMCTHICKIYMHNPHYAQLNGKEKNTEYFASLFRWL